MSAFVIMMIMIIIRIIMVMIIIRIRIISCGCVLGFWRQVGLSTRGTSLAQTFN